MNEQEIKTKKIGNTYQMSLDSFLKDASIEHPSYDTAYEQALNKLYEMNQYRSWQKRQQIAEEALQICDHCIEAYIACGLYRNDIFETVRIYKKGMELATMSFGKDYFQQPISDFFTEKKTHPLFHIKNAYACILFELGYMKKAKEQFTQILSLNPSDKFQVRHYLYCCYLYFEEFEKCFDLYERFQESNTMDLYVKFLYFYKQGLLQEAKQMVPFLEQSNLFLYEILMYQRPYSYSFEKTYEPGTLEEAKFCAFLLRKVCNALEHLPKYLSIHKSKQIEQEN